VTVALERRCERCGGIFSPSRVDPVQAARMTGHTLGTWTRFYAGDYGKAQRDEARARMLEAGFGSR